MADIYSTSPIYLKCVRQEFDFRDYPDFENKTKCGFPDPGNKTKSKRGSGSRQRYRIKQRQLKRRATPTSRPNVPDSNLVHHCAEEARQRIAEDVVIRVQSDQQKLFSHHLTTLRKDNREYLQEQMKQLRALAQETEDTLLEIDSDIEILSKF